MKKRRKTRQIKVGNVTIGGNAPIVVQSMTTTHPKDIKKTVDQILRLEKTGCEIIRIAIPDDDAIKSLPIIKKSIHIPIIGDIHFNSELAIKAVKAGIDGIRINPGNTSKKQIEEFVKFARQYQIAIRIGVNSGSLEKDILKKFGRPSPEAMVESALRAIDIFEKLKYDNIKISLKSSNVLDTIKAHQILAKKGDWPFHIGVTEAGPSLISAVKSSLGIGRLLMDGIGDTVRVSVTGDPIIEMKIVYEILRSLGLRKRGIELISCPTCGRCKVNLIKITQEVEKKLENIITPLKVAVMGCVVNGPGEAKEADIGIACGLKSGVLFKKGKAIRRIEEKNLVKELVKEVNKMAKYASQK